MCYLPIYGPVCDGTQNVGRYRYRYFFPVLNISDTGTGTFFGTKFFRYRFRDFFPIPNLTDTGSETFFRYQIFPIPVPRLFSGTNLFRYRFRYHQKNEKFPVPGIPGTGTSHSGSRAESNQNFSFDQKANMDIEWFRAMMLGCIFRVDG